MTRPLSTKCDPDLANILKGPKNFSESLCDGQVELKNLAYNNTPSSTTGISPFFTNKGYHLSLTVYPERDLASSCAKDLVVNLDELHQELKSTIADRE